MVISNTGPSIALAKADQLALLESLFGRVRIPPAVHRELLTKVGPEAARLDEALRGLIEVTPAPPAGARGQDCYIAAGRWRATGHCTGLRAQSLTGDH